MSNPQPMASSLAVPNIKKRGLSGFFKDVMRELKQVNWPPKYETTRLTGVVIAVCCICTTILFALSIVFNQMHIFLIKK